MNTIEVNYIKYENIGEFYFHISELVYNVAELTVFEKQKKFPLKLIESKIQIDKLKKDLLNGAIFPPVIIQVDNYNKFETIVDGLHRIISYYQNNIKNCKAILVRRIR